MNIAVFLFSLLAVPSFGRKLEQYNVNPDTVTVSGISSGGAFATQYHVAYSTEIKGAALFGGIVYYCAKGIVTNAFYCMYYPSLTNVDSLINKAIKLADSGAIDPTSGMEGDRVYIFSGSLDTTVKPGNGPLIETFYSSFKSDIFAEYDIPAAHCQPTDYYGNACDYLGPDYINNCEYNGAYEALNYMLDNQLIRAEESIPLNGEFYEFDQSEFFPMNSPSKYSMDDTGYMYVPSACMNKIEVCSLHIAFHGCQQAREVIGDKYAKNTGYLQVAEANNIVIMFPQIKHKALSNPNGCWDWWGYTSYTNYVTQDGDQIKGVHNMMERVISG